MSNTIDTDRDNEYIRPSDAARLVGLHQRTIERWGNAGEIRTKDNPRRRGAKLYHRGDVLRLAATVPTSEQAASDAAPPAPSTELVPMGEVLSHIRQLEVELSQAMHEAGRLRGQLEAQTKLLEAADVSEQRRIEAEAE